MARQFVAINQDTIDDLQAASLKARELELAAYDFEAEAHERAIAALGNLEWDETTEPFKGLDRDKIIALSISHGLDEATIQKIQDLNNLERHRHHLLAVKAETAVSERRYEHTLEALPEGERRDAALTRLAEREATVATVPNEAK